MHWHRVASFLYEFLFSFLPFISSTSCNSICSFASGGVLIVSQVHYHIIPAPIFESSTKETGTQDGLSRPQTMMEMHKSEFESREEVDDTEARNLVKDLRARL